MPERDVLRETRAFFGPRADTWDERFPDDGPKFAAAVAQLHLHAGQVALDVGCGTGRALPYLRAAVEPGGIALGLDATPEMAAVARRRGVAVLGDAARLPLRTRVGHAILAAGLINHLPDPEAGLVELGRLTRSGGRLALFHPIGRAALAARRGHDLDPTDVRDPGNLPAALTATGWHLLHLDDGDEQYLALAERRR